MAKTTKKTTAKKTTRRKSTPAKESPTNSKRTTRSAKKAATSTAKKQTRKPAARKKTAGETEVTMDRRRSDRRGSTKPVEADRRKLERREKVSRRRQIDPTTCERDYSDDEVEFMNALDNYKRASGRMFPTCSEILEVIRELGYAKMPKPSGDSKAASEENEVTDDDQASDGPAEVELEEEPLAEEQVLV